MATIGGVKVAVSVERARGHVCAFEALGEVTTETEHQPVALCILQSHRLINYTANEYYVVGIHI